MKWLWLRRVAGQVGVVALLLGIAFFAATQSAADGAWMDDDWQHRKLITIDETMVSGGSDLANFPILVSVTDTDLRSTDFGGGVANVDANDIVFTLDDGTTLLAYELESYNDQTGDLNAWVRLPSLSATIETELYIYYGNELATNQQDPDNVWPADYVMVQHLQEQSGSGNFLADSTSVGNDGIPLGTTPAFNSSSRINGGWGYGGNNQQRIEIADNTSLQLADSFTAEAWARFTSWTTPDHNPVLWKGSQIGWGNNYNFRIAVSNGAPTWGVTCSAEGWFAGGTVSLNTWNHYVLTFDGTTVRGFLNGTEVGSTTDCSGQSLNTMAGNPVRSGFGYRNSPTQETHMAGDVDELRIANQAQSSAWIQTGYNNMNAPETYIGFGPEEDRAPAVPQTPTLHDSGGSTQLAFNNSRIDTQTPTFRVSTPADDNYNQIQLELNTESDFSGTSYTQTTTGAYITNDQYNIPANSLSPSLPTTDNATYYVRVRASADGGTTWGNWSTDNACCDPWSFTYSSTEDEMSWFQQTDVQFDTSTLDAAVTNDGVLLAASSFSATGGTITTIGDSRYHVFTSDGNLTVTGDSSTGEVLVVGGGGGGAGSAGNAGRGGGGAGGLVHDENFSLNSGSYSVTVGTGGAGGAASGADGSQGSNSSFDSLVGIGGGGGAGLNTNGGAGGSGGGAGVNNLTLSGGAAQQPGSSSGGFGSQGGTADIYAVGAGGGGGGGAGAAGGAGTASAGGSGGAGLEFSQFSAVGGSPAGWFAGGGGASAGTTGGPGGTGGGGTGSTDTSSAQSGVTSTGGGGGGSQGTGGGGGDGGSGVVIVRYDVSFAPTGSVTSEPINYSSVPSALTWDEMVWESDESNGSIEMRLLYSDSGTCDALVSDTDLSGNSTGFTTSPVDITGLDSSTYQQLCLEATLTEDGGSPVLQSWGIRWERFLPAVPQTPTLHDSGGSTQLAFNNSRIDTQTPTFRVSTPADDNYNQIQLELNTESDFSGTSYTQTTTGAYITNDQYNIPANSLSPSLPTTDNATYYVRVRASADGGTTWGNWSTDNACCDPWSFTYSSTEDEMSWYQADGAQFATNELTDTVVDGDDVVLGAVGSGITNPTQLTTYTSTTNQASATTASVSPAGNALIVVLVGTGSTTTHTHNAVTSTFGTVGGFTQRTTQLGTSNTFYRYSIYTAVTTASPGSGTITVNYSANTPNQVHYVLQVADGFDTSDPVIQTITATTAATTLSMGFPATPQTSSLVIGGIATRRGTDIAGTSGYTTFANIDTGGGTNARAQSQYRVGDAGIGLNWTGDGTLENMVAGAVEIRAETADDATIMSSEIFYDYARSPQTWGEASFTSNETNGDIKLRLYHSLSTACDTQIPNGDLAGNTVGFDATDGSIDLSGLNTTTYDQICIQATLSDVAGTPYLQSWSVSWETEPNFAPNEPWALAQTKTDTSPLAVGDWTNESSVRFTASATDFDATGDLELCVEARPIGISFLDVQNDCGEPVEYQAPIYECDPTGNALFEKYDGVAGTDIASLYAAPAFPNSPSSNQTISGGSLEGPVNIDDTYGGRLSALICPPQDGDYTFWLSADDNAELRISTDVNPANVTTIASVPGWSGVDEWIMYPEQQSALVTLEADQYYYIEANYNEGAGGDHVQIGWTLPDTTVDRPISGTYYSLPSEEEERTLISGEIPTLTAALNLADADSYHWQARVRDQGGLYSSWVNFGSNPEEERDFGIDTTAPTSGSVYDGDDLGEDMMFNDGSLDTLSANWEGFDFDVSGTVGYEYSIGTTPGGTDTVDWTDVGTDTSFTISSLELQTNHVYYTNIRATDVAGNTAVVSSDGQYVLPTLSFSVSTSNITFENLGASNDRTDSEDVTLTTSTNAYAGYTVRARATGQLNANGSHDLPWFSAGSYASPVAWEDSSTWGYGYTSSDTNVQGSNKFGDGTLFAPFTTLAPGDIVADNTDNTTGVSIQDEEFTITHRVVAPEDQPAGFYSTTIYYTVTADY
ncbi:MAG: DUF2341 domain-containing protein [Candidatus Saccharibacteria bacterium]|nr:DUF2341 domain-containing protein [Candidatus Saccharibacteria bacterium]